MHVFEMVVWIVAIGGVVSIINTFLGRSKNLKKDLQAMGLGDLGLGDGDYVDLERLEQLEERVAVLEKIVTDRRYNLKEEINRL